MEEIKREIWLLQRRRIPPIDIAEGSQIPIALTLMDYSIPAGATAKAYARPWDRETTYQQDVTVEGSTVRFTPPDGFFRAGGNALQIEINGSKIPLLLDVNCGPRLSNGGEGATPEAVRPLVDRAESAAKAAAGQAAEAKASADAAEKSAQGIRDSAEKIDMNAEGVSQLKEDIGSEISSTLNGKKETIKYILPEFTKGMYNKDTGEIVDGDEFIRTKDFIQVDKDTSITITVPSEIYLRIQSWQYYQDTWQYYGREVDAVNYELTGTINFMLRKNIRTGATIPAKFAFILHYADNRVITDVDSLVQSIDFGNRVIQDYEIKYIPNSTKPIILNELKNKKIICYGDSITAEGNDLNDTSWQSYLYNYFEFGKYVGSGIGGTGFCPMLSHKFILPSDYIDGTSLSVNSVINGTAETLAENMDLSSWYRINRCIPADADIIVVMAGTNDFGRIVGSALPSRKRDSQGYVYGNWLFDSDITDTTRDIEWTESDLYATYGGDFNRETVAGAIESTIMKLQAKCPNALIIFATPVKTNVGSQWQNNTNSGQKYLNGEYYKIDNEVQLCFETDYQKIIKDICVEWGVPVIDIYGESCINHANYIIGNFQGSGVHPNANGKKMIGRAFISGFKCLVSKF